jgi:hypothetical protein
MNSQPCGDGYDDDQDNCGKSNCPEVMTQYTWLSLFVSGSSNATALHMQTVPAESHAPAAEKPYTLPETHAVKVPLTNRAF